MDNEQIIIDITYDGFRFTFNMNCYITDLSDNRFPIQRSIEYCNLIDNEMWLYDCMIADYIRDVFDKYNLSPDGPSAFKIDVIDKFINKYPKFKIQII